MCTLIFFWGTLTCWIPSLFLVELTGKRLWSRGTRSKDQNLTPGMCLRWEVHEAKHPASTFLLFSVWGFNPAWNESFQFDVYVPELALVRFVVEDYDSKSDNEFVGQYTLPFNSLKMGKFSSRPAGMAWLAVTQWRFCFSHCMVELSLQLHKDLFVSSCLPDRFVLPRRIQTRAAVQ